MVFEPVTCNSDFIRIQITDEMIHTATSKSNEMGALRNSIRGGKGNVVGFLGEESILTAFPAFHSNNSYNFDITSAHLCMEVKSKQRSVAPAIHYECSVSKYNTRQAAHMYIFTSITCINGSYTDAYILGWLPKSVFFNESIHLKEGDYDPSNNFYVKCDCLNIPIHKLYKPSYLYNLP